jgi:DNA-binding NarL/FixJ family response regulator
MKVFLVEDSSLILKRLTEMLGALPHVVVCGHANSAGEAIEEILQLRPEVVLLDLQLNTGAGFDVLTAVRQQAPEIDFYVLTNFISERMRGLAATLGAKGFYDKSKDFQAVRDLIAERAAREGGST